MKWVKNNSAVALSFMFNKAGKRRSFSTDGKKIWSYDTCIAFKKDDFVIMTNNYYSPTTTRHKYLIRNAVNFKNTNVSATSTGKKYILLEVKNFHEDITWYEIFLSEKEDLKEFINQFKKSKSRAPFIYEDIVYSKQLIEKIIKKSKKQDFDIDNLFDDDFKKKAVVMRLEQ